MHATEHRHRRRRRHGISHANGHNHHHHGVRRRRSHTVLFDLRETADEGFDRIIESLLIALLVFSPLALGAVQAWSEMAVLLLAGMMAVVLGIKLVRRPHVPFIRSWTYIPVALFIGLTAFQLVPLPAQVVRLIAPGTFALRQSLMSNVPESARHLDVMPLSLYPEATIQNLRVLLSVATVYVVALNTIRQLSQVRRLLMVIAAIGAMTALVGFLHLAAGAERIYGIVGELPRAWPLGPFMNRNHFGQLMNLSLGAAAALVLIQVDELLGSRRNPQSPDEHILEQIPPLLWAMIAAGVVIGAGICLSLSRGAIMAAAISGSLAMLLARRGQTAGARLWLLLPLLWAVALVVISTLR